MGIRMEWNTTTIQYQLYASNSELLFLLLLQISDPKHSYPEISKENRLAVEEVERNEGEAICLCPVFISSVFSSFCFYTEEEIKPRANQERKQGGGENVRRPAVVQFKKKMNGGDEEGI